ncbi:MAG TPA: cyclic nucleotide-binding domain-containing protein, partial [Calditrichaeota bacterium]|nr:cyclic nucleotide-binding domain-containing protein [Calditrichota bacterium]
MNKHRVNKLKKTPLFSGVSDDDLALIAERLDELEFKAGETVIREEEPGDAFFIIEKGKVRISASIDENDEIILSYLEAGDYFGEMALLTGDVRSATVTADEDLKLLKLKKEEKIKAYLIDFGKKHNLETLTDEVGNVL